MTSTALRTIHVLVIVSWLIATGWAWHAMHRDSVATATDLHSIVITDHGTIFYATSAQYYLALCLLGAGISYILLVIFIEVFNRKEVAVYPTFVPFRKPNPPQG